MPSKCFSPTCLPACRQTPWHAGSPTAARHESTCAGGAASNWGSPTAGLTRSWRSECRIGNCPALAIGSKINTRPINCEAFQLSLVPSSKATISALELSVYWLLLRHSCSGWTNWTALLLSMPSNTNSRTNGMADIKSWVALINLRKAMAMNVYINSVVTEF